MYLVPIGWLYVALMMALAEGMASHGSWLGAAVTFVLYGLLPTALLMYLLGAPGRRRLRKAQEAAERAALAEAAATADAPPSAPAPPPAA
ncbi:MAG TPA: hypothetical protein PKC59_14260 [Burkholderiaceae bacterium]|nr:hypothetical protein [Burkholderiaceae bacterium]HMZ01024.1 hypothetical protein [Burkholderiaceae bacterium]HNB44766.1 hypothetical protein [Burkholderiaceae bacterium]HNG79018.1 hypothetical protein [Burkholderiaceae bacterium]